jgi:hypothetical protein
LGFEGVGEGGKIMNKSRRQRIGEIQTRLLCLVSELNEIIDEEKAATAFLTTDGSINSSRMCSAHLHDIVDDMQTTISDLDNAIITASE